MQNIRSKPSKGALSPIRVLMIAAVVAIALGLLMPALGAAEPGTLKPTATHVVEPGETLWKIAQTHSPESDPRSYVYDIQKINGLSGAMITPGQELILP